MYTHFDEMMEYPTRYTSITENIDEIENNPSQRSIINTSSEQSGGHERPNTLSMVSQDDTLPSSINAYD